VGVPEGVWSELGRRIGGMLGGGKGAGGDKGELISG